MVVFSRKNLQNSSSFSIISFCFSGNKISILACVDDVVTTVDDVDDDI